ncbi:hypothetical protein AVEN_169101-1, partial [Araneus ventricosus]
MVPRTRPRGTGT